MSISDEQVKRAKAAAEKREARGYFARVKDGDPRAASLFARLVAFDLNPTGRSSDFGTLTKPAGGSNVDGYADDAICYSNDPNNLENVIDLVGGAGAPGARVIAEVKPRRAQDLWEKPKPLSDDDMAYLLDGGEETVPAPPMSTIPGYESIGGDSFFRSAVGAPLEGDAKLAGESLNEGSSVWFSRSCYDILAARMVNPAADVSPIIKKHRTDWRALMPTPPAGWPPL